MSAVVGVTNPPDKGVRVDGRVARVKTDENAQNRQNTERRYRKEDK